MKRCAVCFPFAVSMMIKTKLKFPLLHTLETKHKQKKKKKETWNTLISVTYKCLIAYEIYEIE